MELDRPRLARRGLRQAAPLWLLVSCLARAGEAHLPPGVDQEKFFLIGWNRACSVALSRYGYPVLGEAIAEDPIMTRIGTLTIAPGSEAQRASWTLSLNGPRSWDPAAASKARSDLKRAGYVLPGLKETMRPDPIAPGRGLEGILRSTEAFKAAPPSGWPKGDWAPSQIYYSSLDACGLLVYKNTASDRDFFRFLLVRIHHPSARPKRAAAHVTNGLLLLQQGDADGALAETAIAAEMAPENASARYHHGAMLCLKGFTKEALDELEAAVRLDRRYAAKAREDRDWEALSSYQRFQELAGH